jgi:NADH-quinone oxidoreductase subunit N
MTVSALISILPFIVLSVGMLVILLLIAFWRNHVVTAGLTLLTLALAFASVFIALALGSAQVTPLLIMDGYAGFIIGLLLAASFVIALLAYGYLRIHEERREEFYLLLLTATLGSCVLAASSHFASFFLGLEVLSLSLYALIAYTYNSPISVEAGVKYLVLAAGSAAFLLFGMALVYTALGTMEFTKIATAIAASGSQVNPVFLLAGIVLMLVGIGFKLALVPFHLWTPDVYEGSPAPVTAFVATVSKGSMFAVLVRFFSHIDPRAYTPLFVVFVALAIATILIGNLLALMQNNLKRMLAYSSVANLGYLLVAFIAGGANGTAASTFYLVAYFVTILAAFGVVTVLSSRSRDAGWLDEYRGLMWSRPWLAAVLTAAMFSLAGLPLTVGFVGKFYLVLAGVGSALWLLVVVLVIGSAISLYYYLRVVVVMYNRSAQEVETSTPAPAISAVGGLALAALLLLIVGMGVFPAPLLDLVQLMTKVR